MSKQSVIKSPVLFHRTFPSIFTSFSMKGNIYLERVINFLNQPIQGKKKEISPLLIIPANYSTNRVNYYNIGCGIKYLGQGINEDFNFQIDSYSKIKRNIEIWKPHDANYEPILENSLRNLDYIYAENMDHDRLYGIAFIYHTTTELFTTREDQEEVNELLLKFFKDKMNMSFIFLDGSLDSISKRLFQEFFQIIDSIEKEQVKINEAKYEFINGDIFIRTNLIEEYFLRYSSNLKSKKPLPKPSQQENPELKDQNTQSPFIKGNE